VLIAQVRTFLLMRLTVSAFNGCIDGPVLHVVDTLMWYHDAILLGSTGTILRMWPFTVMVLCSFSGISKFTTIYSVQVSFYLSSTTPGHVHKYYYVDLWRAVIWKAL